MQKLLKIALAVLASLVALAVVLVAGVYLWPHESEHRQTGTPESLSYDTAVARADEKVALDARNAVTPECRSKLLTHGEKRAKTVVFLHGIRMCPSQFDEITAYFHEHGYNVYTPVAPHHGTAVHEEHGKVRADELIDYVNESISIATGLGDEVGVVGLSGGGLLGTWAAEFRPEVERLLLLSPFYEPAASQAPKWQLPLLMTMHGNHVIPDAYSNGREAENPGFSYRALAQYLIIETNLRDDPTGLSLKSIGKVVSGDDDLIDHDLARSVPAGIAEKNHLELLEASIPAEWAVGHEITDVNVPGVRQHRDELFGLYLSFYEGHPAAL